MSGGVLSAEMARALADTGRPRLKPFSLDQFEALLVANGLAPAPGARPSERGSPLPTRVRPCT